MEKDEGPAPVAGRSGHPPARYLALIVTAPPEAADAVGNLLHEAGTGGVVEEEGPAGTVRLRAFLRKDFTASVVDGLHRRLAALPTFGLGEVAPELRVEELADESWATVWKAHFHAFPVGRRLWIVPTWERPALPPRALPIRLDPGMAFGSGLHASTQLCLRLLEEQLRPGQVVADIGTGSGILAIAAAKLGAGRVLAVDHDPVAVEVAWANAAHNEVGDVVTVTVGELLDPLPGPVDLILANLTADLLIPLASQIPPRLRPGGRAVISGIADVREAEVRQAFAHSGCIVLATAAAEEWRALVAAAEEVRA